MIAWSDAIIVATLRIPAEQLRTAMKGGSHRYIDIPLSDVRLLKGTGPTIGLTLAHYSKDIAGSPNTATLMRRDAKPSLLFLVSANEGPKKLYFSRSSEALQNASDARLKAARTELRRQQLIQQLPVNPTLPHAKLVHRLLAGLHRARRARQDAIFRQLEALGRAGVPAIIAQMDDRRPLATTAISLRNNFPNAFEGIRHYRPERVVDALDAILNQLTGEGASIVNGGSDAQRSNAVAAWHVYSADLKCK